MGDTLDRVLLTPAAAARWLDTVRAVTREQMSAHGVASPAVTLLQGQRGAA